MAIRLDTAVLIGIMIETLLFGIYLAMFPATVYVLLAAKRAGRGGRNISAIWLGVNAFLFVVICTNWALDMDRMYQAFIVNQDKKLGAIIFFATLWDTREVVRISFFMTQIIVLDGILLFRSYIIWGKNWWVIVVPGFTYAGTAVAEVVVCVLYSRASFAVDIYDSPLGRWITASFSLNMATNLICVGLIVFRLVQRDRGSKKAGATPIGGSGLMRLLLIIVESAAVVCVTNATTLIALVAHSNGRLVSLSFSPPITGISFGLIVLRIGFARAFEHWMQPVSAPSGSGSGMSAAYRSPHGEHAVIPMHVRITRERTLVDSDVDKDMDADSVEAKPSMLRAGDVGSAV